MTEGVCMTGTRNTKTELRITEKKYDHIHGCCPQQPHTVHSVLTEEKMLFIWLIYAKIHLVLYCGF